MGRRWYLYLFAIDLLLELFAIVVREVDLRYFTKPLLMILLFLYVTLQYFRSVRPKFYLQVALFFSLLGDICLLIDATSGLYFIAGLCSFLVAHIFYILFFLWVKKANQPSKRWDPKIIFMMLVYAAGLLYFLYPHLRTLRVPVSVYALVLSGMLVAAVHAFAVRQQVAGFFCVAGAALFVISDSLLAIDRFYSSFFLADLSIMLTYALAQLFIILGGTSFLRRYSQAG